MKSILRIFILLFMILMSRSGYSQNTTLLDNLIDSSSEIISGRLIDIEQSLVRISEGESVVYYYVSINEVMTGTLHAGDTVVIRVRQRICNDFKDTSGTLIIGKSYVFFLHQPNGSFMGKKAYQPVDRWFFWHEASSCFVEELKNKYAGKRNKINQK